MVDLEAVAGQGRSFAERLRYTIASVLPGETTIGAIVVAASDAVLITAVDGDQPTAMPLYVDGQVVATWRIHFQASLDRSGTYLKTIKSAMVLTSVFEKTPLARLEYDSRMHTAPVAHWQFHGERGAFSHLLARAHAVRSYVTEKPHSLSALHFPVGGERFRPGVEDFLEFLVRECGVDHKDGWQSAIIEGREIWRRFQMRAISRELQVEAAETLRINGWSVRPPSDYDDDERLSTLHQW